MRSLPHSVAVVTSLAESPSLQPNSSIDPSTDNVELLSPYFHDFCGATISSLQSVTLGPPAMISFNLKMPSRTLSGLLRHKQFGIHLLLDDYTGQEVAEAFVKQPHSEAFRSLSHNGRWVGLGLSPIERVEDLEKRVPLIRGNGVFRFLRCEILADKSVQVGDHMVVIAKVASVGVDEATATRGDTSKRRTLVYVHGGYHGISSFPKPKHVRKAKKTILPIRKNSLSIHNDALGTSTFSKESMLAKFCYQVRHELPESFQDLATEFLLRDLGWPVKAQVMLLARESHARGEHPTPKTFQRRRVQEWRIALEQIRQNSEVRSPSNFREYPPEDCPSASPPWNDGIDRSSILRDAHNIRFKRDNAVQDSSQQSSVEMRDAPKPGSDPLGAMNEEEDGDLSILTEEGYRNLTKKLGIHTEGQDELQNGKPEGRPENESVQVEPEERTDTGIAPEQQEVLKNSPS